MSRDTARCICPGGAVLFHIVFGSLGGVRVGAFLLASVSLFALKTGAPLGVA